jgi:predicted TPR repeat methyltransferase
MSKTSAEIEQVVQLHSEGAIDEALAACLQILQREPDHADACHLAGILFFQLGQAESAIDWLRRAIALDPARALFQSNLGNVLRLQGRIEDALAAYRRSVEADPRFAEGHFNLAAFLEELGNQDEALAGYRRALHANPAFVEAHNNLGSLLARKGLLHQAVFHHCQALRLSPEAPGLESNLLRTLRRMGLLAESDPDYRTALRAMTKDPRTEFVVAALLGDAPPGTAPPGYVAELFDDYAEQFDQHLVEELGYRTPELLSQAVDRVLPGRSLDVLDLGCGTGLAGLLFRDRARSLSGLDLSAKMVAKARERSVYDKLTVGDVLPALREAREAFDLILAADVFVYVGDLDPIFQAVRTALRPGGGFAFSVEAHQGDGFVLRSTGRFAHAADYLRSLARASGLEERFFSQDVLRTQHHQPVQGYLAVFVRPA